MLGLAVDAAAAVARVMQHKHQRKKEHKGGPVLLAPHARFSSSTSISVHAPEFTQLWAFSSAPAPSLSSVLGAFVD